MKTSKNLLNGIKANHKPFNIKNETQFKNALDMISVVDKMQKFTNTEYQLDKIDEAVTDFNDILLTAAKLTVKNNNTSKYRQNCKKPQSKKWYNYDCKYLKNIVKTAVKQVNKFPSNPNFRKQYNDAKRKYKVKLKETEREYKKQIYSSLTKLEKNNPKEFWKAIENLKETSKITVPKSDLIDPNSWYNYFEELHGNNGQSTELIPSDNNHINKQINNPISIQEITKCINKLKTKKAVGPDLISNSMIKFSHNKIITKLHKLFNLIFNSKTFPTLWSSSNITPIFKSGDPTNPSNYRGISVGSCLGKLFCQIISDRITKYCYENNIIHENQIGFKKGSRTADHIFTLTSLVHKYIKNKTKKPKFLYACFVDFKKAFDSVPFDLLLNKLENHGINGKVLHMITSLYNKCTASVKLSSGLSNSFKCNKGVRQGCPLSPILFNLYINDVISSLETNLDPTSLPELDNKNINSLLYADDLAILALDETTLQLQLNSLADFSERNKLEINTSKTKIMIFTPGKIPKSMSKRFFFQKQNIEIVDSYTYLGLTLSHNGSMKLGQNILLGKASKAYFALRSKLDLNYIPRVSSIAFDSYILPIFTYSSEIWGAFENYNLCNIDKTKYELFQLKFCKTTLGVHSKATNIAVRLELGRLPIIHKIYINMIKYWFRLLSCPRNSLLHKAYISSENLSKSGIKCWAFKVRNILNKLGLNNLWSQIPKDISDGTFNENYYLNKIKHRLEDQYLQMCRSMIDSRSKLNIYRNVNTCHYLQNIENPTHRTIVTKLRISAHNLNIEQMRHSPSKPPIFCRTCPFCKNDKVETEFHFITECEKFKQIREQFYDKICSHYPQFKTFNTNAKLYFILDPYEDMAQCVGYFLYQMYSLRDNLMST